MHTAQPYQRHEDKAYVVIYKYTLCLYVLHSTSVYTQAPTYKAYVPVHYTQPYKNMKTRHRLSYTSIHYVYTSYKALLYIHRPLPIRPMYTKQPYQRHEDKAYIVIYQYTLCLYILQSTSVYALYRPFSISPMYTAHSPTRDTKTRHRLSYTSIHYVCTSYKALLYIHRPLPIRPMYTTQPYTRDMKRGGASGGWSSHPP